jgi:hypothetical protein
MDFKLDVTDWVAAGKSSMSDHLPPLSPCQIGASRVASAMEFLADDTSSSANRRRRDATLSDQG